MSQTYDSEIHQQILKSFGYIPIFFKAAEKNPVVLRNLWNQTLTGYLENPLPRLFIEKLSAKLSRYSTVSYCLINHCSSLHILGLTGEDVFHLLESPTITQEELSQKDVSLLSTNPGQSIEPDSAIENFIIDCAVGIYLNKESDKLLKVLRKYVNENDYHYILMLISYKKSAHLWSESHPEISFEKDPKLAEHFHSMTNEETKLKEYFNNYTEDSDQLHWHQRATSERQLKLISNALPVLIAYVDADKRYRFVNTAYERWFKVSSNELIGVHIRDFVGQAVYESAEPFLDRALNGETIEFEHEAAYKNGSRFIRVAYTPDIDAKGKVRGVVSLVSDIGDQKMIERNLKKAVSSRDEFLSVASHELMTPLTSLQLHTQMIQKSVKANQESQYDIPKLLKFVDQTGHQVHKLTRLVDDMLDISRTDSGKLTYHLETFNLNSLVADVVERLQPIARQSKINMILEMNGNAEVHWDSFRIDQVLTNLISNAIRYGQGSPINIELSIFEESAFIKVTDYGMGIAPENQERIFGRFERASIKEVNRGLGLGLYICKEIVNGHGGRISVDSVVGKGSTFTVEIPIK